MQCQEFFEIAERWMEGAQDAAASAHLDGCPRCRGLIADLGAIREGARQFEAEVEPPARLWTAIRSQLEAEQVIRPSRTWAERFADFFPLQVRPALAAAYVTVLVVAATLASFQGMGPMEKPLVLAPGAPEIAALPASSSLAAQRAVNSLSARNPAVVRSYRESLRTVENVISECELMIRKDPADQMAREYLNGAYQQKAELISAIVERGTLGE
jgi:hypothetical protein